MVLGAVLLTGYFGGAIVVHIIDKESVFPLIMIGVWVWGGIYFRAPALQTLFPLRRENGVQKSIEPMGDSRAIPGRNPTASRA
jgi:hypothetical protein